MKNLIFSILVLLLAISCNKDENNITASELLGCWKHDIETENTSGSIYFMTRCEAKEFPNGYWRYSLIFEDGRKGSELQLAENDAHFYADITWSISEDRLYIDKEDIRTEYIIEIVNDESIRLTRK
jgi:hypothetical protein